MYNHMFYSYVYGATVTIKITSRVSIYAEVYIIQCFSQTTYR